LLKNKESDKEFQKWKNPTKKNGIVTQMWIKNKRRRSIIKGIIMFLS
jgi:hypothetical protein